MMSTLTKTTNNVGSNNTKSTQSGCIWLIETYLPRFGLPDWLFANAAKVIASVPSLTWNYLTYNRFVFRDQK